MMPPSSICKFAAGLYLLALAGAMIAPISPPTVLPTKPARPLTNARQTLDHKQVIGFSLNVHHTEQLPRYLRAIDSVAQLGCNSLQILTPAFQTDGAATQISIPNLPGRCPSTDQLLKLLRYAQDRGLKTLLMPTILFTNPRGNEWRGKISPENWDAWWESYSTNMCHFAQLAQQAKVDVFSVGSELLSTERQTQRWQQLITRLRTIYHGQLIYSTNWDHYNVPEFWDQLDYVGISGYWRMADDLLDPAHNPNDYISLQSQMADRWKPIQQTLRDFAKQVNKPILITELGYPCLPWGLKDPWNYVNDAHTPAVPAVQTAGYQAFCDNWTGLIQRNKHFSANGFAGVMFYAWDPYNGGMTDSGYGIWGKPAQQLLHQWLSGMARP
jgi:hypothetical protein